jgi:hypothetical protein
MQAQEVADMISRLIALLMDTRLFHTSVNRISDNLEQE